MAGRVVVDGGVIGSMRHQHAQPTGLGRTDSSYFFDPIAGEVFTVMLYLQWNPADTPQQRTPMI